MAGDEKDMGFLSVGVQAWVAAFASLLVQSFYLVLLFFMFGLKTNLAKHISVDVSPSLTLPASPAEIGYLYHADYHYNCLVASLVHLAIEGIISIADHYEGWIIHMEAPCPSARAQEEKFLFQKMFKDKKTYLIERDAPTKFAELNKSFQIHMDKTFGSKLTKPHIEAILGVVTLAIFGGFLTFTANNCSAAIITIYSALSFVLAYIGTLILRKPTSYLLRGHEIVSDLRSKIMKGPDPSKNTGEIIEDYFLKLPHAIALEVGRFWTIATVEMLKSRGVDPSSIEPEWYSNENRGLMDIIGLIDGLIECLKNK